MIRELNAAKVAASVSVCVCMVVASVVTSASCPMIKPKTIPCPGHQPTVCGPWGFINGIVVCNPATYENVNSHPLTNESNAPNETNTAVDVDPNNKVTCWEVGPCFFNPVTFQCFKLPVTLDQRTNPLILIDC